MYDVIIIGGSYSGLSAALTLGRSLRTVLVFDDGKPCNRTALISHNFLGSDGINGAVLRERTKEDLLRYDTIQFVYETAQYIENTSTGFVVYTQNGISYKGRKLLIATGLSEKLPHVEGLKECWGKTVLHCPYCHGYEYRKRPTAIVASGNEALQLVQLLIGWTDLISVFTNGDNKFTTGLRNALGSAGIEMVESPIKRLEHQEGTLKHVEFKNGTRRDIDLMYISPVVNFRGSLAIQLGCSINDDGRLQTNSQGCTTVNGVYAAGDIVSTYRSISVAVASGTIAGMSINKALAVERSFVNLAI